MQTNLNIAQIVLAAALIMIILFQVRGGGLGGIFGQQSTVFIHKLICEGTIEERILELQARKSALIAGLLDSESTSLSGLSTEDIDYLFAPVG